MRINNSTYKNKGKSPKLPWNLINEPVLGEKCRVKIKTRTKYLEINSDNAQKINH